MIYPFTFDIDVALEAILYIANRVNSPTFHKISKLMYFADRKHLEEYGRFICGDSYVAMQHGPVPSGIYDILKSVRFSGCECHTEMLKGAFAVDEYTVKPLRNANCDYFSDSDLACLDWAIEKFGNKSFDYLTRLSHDKAWQSADENDFISVEQIVVTFDAPGNLLEHLRDPYPG